MTEPRTDQRADIYAFGVLSFEVLTGRTPFGGRSPQDTVTAHVTEAPVPIDTLRPGIPRALAVLVTQCLAKFPADRPQETVALMHAVDALVTPTGSTPHVAPDVNAASATPPPPRDTAHRRRLRALIGSIGGAAVVAIGAMLLQRPAAPADARLRIGGGPLSKRDRRFLGRGRGANDRRHSHARSGAQ